MAKNKYFFNPDTLSYTKVEFSIKKLIAKLASRLMITLLLGVFLFIFAWYNFDSPTVRILKTEANQILLKYELLNKRISHSTQVLDYIQRMDNDVYRSFFEEPIIPSSVRKAGFGGSNRYDKYKNMEYSEVLIHSNRNLDILSKQIYVQSLSFDRLIHLIQQKERMLACIPLIPPVRKEDIIGFCPFGMRLHPILNYVRMHNGVDLVADLGKPVYATGSGIVTVNKFNSGLGNYIVINHGFGYESLYGHNSKVLVTVGQKIKRGDIIALVGTTGLSFVTHVHYEVHKNGRPVDPVNFFYDELTDQEFDKIKIMAENSSELGAQ